MAVLSMGWASSAYREPQPFHARAHGPSGRDRPFERRRAELNVPVMRPGGGVTKPRARRSREEQITFRR